jgi:hypothetical protein
VVEVELFGLGINTFYLLYVYIEAFGAYYVFPRVGISLDELG